MKTANFVKIVESIKEKSSLDLSSGEDLSIALMNLVSLEEHFLFSYMKTEDKTFLEYLDQVRETRKRLLGKIVTKDEGDYSEKWCISKHLLASAMRLSEVGTKYNHEGKKTEAEEMMREASKLYELFWVINGINGEKEKNNAQKKGSVKEPGKLSQLVKKMLDCCRE